MFTKAGYNESLRELVKANKADKSVANIIKENLSIQADAKNIIKRNEKEIKALNNESDEKSAIKKETPLFNFKAYFSITKELKDIKKQLKKKNNEVKKYNKQIEKAELLNNALEEEIENQYKIYQENEIYTQAFYRIDRNLVAISDETYNSYENYIEMYNNSVYSAKMNSKLPKPKAEDLVGILNTLKEGERIIKENEEAQKKKKSVTKKKASTKKAE